jgi:negative regulator of sigma E activity
MKHYEYEISLYADGELSDDESREMFAHLAECSECRNLYSEFSLLEKKVKENYSKSIMETIADRKMPALSSIILRQPKLKVNESNESKTLKNIPIRKNVNTFYKTAFYTTAAAAVILLFVLISTKKPVQFIKNNDIRIDTVLVPKEKTIVKYVRLVRHPENSNKDYLEYVNSIPFTKNIVAMEQN